MNRTAVKTVSLLTSVFMVASLLIGVGLFHIRAVEAVPLPSRSMELNNTIPGQSGSYVVSFLVPTAGTLGSIKAEFCDNSPLFTEACNPPLGFSLSGATLTTQSGETGFSVDPSSTSNVLILSRPPASSVGSVQVSYTLDNVHNPTNEGSQYVRYSTYASADASGSATDQGGLVYSINPSLSVNTEVPPYLEICVGVTITGTDCTSADGNYLNLGAFSTNTVSGGQTQLAIATNALNGYSVALSGSTLTSGNNIIPPLTVPSPSAPGSSQFGVNLRSNTVPAVGQDPSGGRSGTPTADYNQPNRFVYRSGDIIASYGQAEDYRKYTTTYMVNISRAQSPGVYASTFVYTGLGNF